MRPQAGRCWIVVVLLAFGCRPAAEPVDPRAGFVSVHGRVTLDGQPLAHAKITFLPAHPDAYGAIGITDDNGQYELIDSKEKLPGAVPAEYRVLISRLEKEGDVIRPLLDYAPAAEVPAGAAEIVPGGYSSLLGSQLKATIPKNGGTIDFPLDSQFK